MTTNKEVYPNDLPKQFIEEYYFDCDKKYKREKLSRLRDNLEKGKCPKSETTIRAYCMYLNTKMLWHNANDSEKWITYPHEFYGRKIPKCVAERKGFCGRRFKKKPKEFTLIDEPEKSPEQPVQEFKIETIDGILFEGEDAENYMKAMRIINRFEKSDPDKIINDNWSKVFKNPEQYEKRFIMRYVKCIIKKFEN